MALRDLLFTIRSKFDNSGTEEAKDQIDSLDESSKRFTAGQLAGFAALAAAANEFVQVLQNIREVQDEINRETVSTGNLAAQLGISPNLAANLDNLLEAADVDAGVLRGVFEGAPQFFEDQRPEERIETFFQLAQEAAIRAETDPTGTEQRLRAEGLGETDVFELLALGRTSLAFGGATPGSLAEQFNLVDEQEEQESRRERLVELYGEDILQETRRNEDALTSALLETPGLSNLTGYFAEGRARSRAEEALNGTTIVNNNYNNYEGSLLSESQVVEDRRQQTTEAIDEGLIYDITR